LVQAASAGSQPSGPRSPWSPVRQAPRNIASPIDELAEMEGGRSAITGAQPRGQIDADVSDADESERLWSGAARKPRRRTSGYGSVGDGKGDRRACQRRSVQGHFEQPCNELSGDDGSDGCREAPGAAPAPTLRRSTGCYRRHEASEDSDADDGRACERSRLRSLVVVPDRAAVRRSHSPDDVYGCKELRRSAGRSQRGSTHRRRSGSRR